jgi:GntR family transcriptional repressor for pyruvate dehydrogenase complex
VQEKLKLFKPVKKIRVYEEIVGKVKDMIEKGRLKSGDQLPGERELAEVFNVSRSSVREALRALESQGFLESRQGEGTYIASKPVESLVNPLAAFISTEKDSQMELFEMRRVIEPQLAYLAAERATQEDIALMEQALDLQEEAVARGEVGTDVDKTFHYIMAKATKNKFLLRMTDSVMDLCETGCQTDARTPGGYRGGAVLGTGIRERRDAPNTTEKGKDKDKGTNCNRWAVIGQLLLARKKGGKSRWL